MDDVDRLFECFKCGISPPQSAIREKKAGISKFKQQNSRLGGSSTGDVSTASVERSKHKSPNIHLSRNDEANRLNASKPFSPVVFYGSPHGVPPKRPISLLRLLREIHVDLAEKHKSYLRKETWATFPRQEEAIKFVKEHPTTRIFSYQDHFNGQRRFLAATYGEFWQRYKNMDPKFRHHYEVIQEGLPCHLYFDLEYNKGLNMDRNEDQMVDLLIAVIFEALREKYNLSGEEDWIVELDSSTKEKFSRHLLIRIPKAAFKDNLHVGAFVAEICSRIHNAKEKDPMFEELFVSKDSEGSPLQLFIDSAVYSRNRCFRLPLSSKAGKNSMLVPTSRFKCKDMCVDNMFMASLICNMDDDCEKLLVCKTSLDCAKTLQFDTEVTHSCQKRSNYSPHIAINACRSDVSGTYCMGGSPFPVLDAFIESVASSGNVPGRIRSWYWFSKYNLMAYSMSRNRYCERIGREHKSNHVLYVVDLQWALYYQKCHDPDCRDYRSPSRPVPLNVLPEEFSSDHMGNNVESMENNLSLAENGEENLFVNMEDNSNDGWWLEALKVADSVERMGTLEFESMGHDDASDDDEEWWKEVEKAVSQTELYMNK